MIEKKYKVAIIGSRNFEDYDLLKSKLINKVSKIECIVSGGAKGADSLGEKFAKEFGIPTNIFLPDWEQYGRSAGMKRNLQIIENSDVVIAFWDGVSKGTQHGISIAQRQKKKLLIVRYNAEINKVNKWNGFKNIRGL